MILILPFTQPANKTVTRRFDKIKHLIKPVIITIIRVRHGLSSKL